MVVSDCMDREILFHQTYLHEVLLRVSLYWSQDLKFIKEMKKVGGNFLVLCSTPGKLCNLSYPLWISSLPKTNLHHTSQPLHNTAQNSVPSKFQIFCPVYLRFIFIYFPNLKISFLPSFLLPSIFILKFSPPCPSLSPFISFSPLLAKSPCYFSHY